MNKRQLIDAVARQLGTTKSSATIYVDAVLDTIVHGVCTEEKVAISGFGTFKHRSRKSRQIVNPSTKEMMTLPVTVTVGFTPSQNLKEAVTVAVVGDPEAQDAAEGTEREIREVKPSTPVEALSNCA